MLSVTTKECCWGCSEGVDTSVDVLEPCAGVFASKSLWVEVAEPSPRTACARHLSCLRQASSCPLLLEITYTKEWLTADQLAAEAARIKADREKGSDAAAAALSVLLYETKVSYKVVDRTTGTLVAVWDPAAPHSLLTPDVSRLVAQIIDAPALTAEVATFADDWSVELTELELAPGSLPQITADQLKCVDCGRTTNLWLNLCDGYVGCGRKQYGVENSGCEGGLEGAAIRHWQHLEETGHSGYHANLRLGTLTGVQAEMYSYMYDSPVHVPAAVLAERLALFGIDRQTWKPAKEKTLAELMGEANSQLDVKDKDHGIQARVNDLGDVIGAQNIGNSCYLASVFQLLARVCDLALLESVEGEPANEKIGVAGLHFMRALRTSKPDAAYMQAYSAKYDALDEALKPYVLPADESYHYGAPTPLFVKRLLGTKYRQFNNADQQDAEEFLQVILASLPQAVADQCKLRGVEARGQPFHGMVLDVLFPPQVHACYKQISEAFGDKPKVCAEKVAAFREAEPVDLERMLVEVDVRLAVPPPFLFICVRRMTEGRNPMEQLKIMHRVRMRSREIDIAGLVSADVPSSAPPAEIDAEWKDIVEEALSLGFSESQARATVQHMKAEGTPAACVTTEDLVMAILDGAEAGGGEEAAGGEAVGGSVSTRYELAGAVHHRGSQLASGHYFATLAREGWVEINDEYVRTNVSGALDDAYLLLLRRR